MTNKYLILSVLLIIYLTFKINGILIEGNLCGKEGNARLLMVRKTQNQRNMYVYQDIMAVIFQACPIYKLNDPNIQNISNFFTYKVCKDYMERSRFQPNQRMISNITILQSNQAVRFNLYIPVHQKLLKIQTKPCKIGSATKAKWIFYWKNEEIIFRKNPNFNYSSNIFIASNMSKTPIIMKIIDSDVSPLTVELNINLVETGKCSQDKCIGNCTEAPNTKLGYKCVVTINGKQFSAGYKGNICNNGLNKYPNEWSLCDYFEKRNRSLCEDECLSTQNCGYICTKVKFGTSRIESGYIASNEMWIESDIGLDQVKWYQLPIEKVYFNECYNVNKTLCIPDRTTNLSSSCVDMKIGFACSNGGHINETQCLASKSKSIHSYWICNGDAKDSNSSDFNLEKEMTDFKEFKKSILSLRISESKKFHLFMKVMKFLKDTVKNETNKTDVLNDRKQYAAFLIGQMENFNNINTNFSDNSITIKNIPFPMNSKNFSLSLPPIAEDNSEQFIHLELLEESHTRSNAELKANFIYYHKLDLIGENKTLEEEIKLSQDLGKSKGTRHTNGTVLFRNSDMFSVKFNKPTKSKIIYKIASYFKYKRGSWLFEIEEKCGFLDIEKGWVWSTKKCRKMSNDYCQCDHLTNFALLFSITPVNEIHLRVLELLSYFGGVVNIISLILFLVFILAINTRDKLRLDQLNVALCLLAATTVYLLGGLASNYDTLCSIVAISSQYLFMSAFVWKLILGINVVRMVASIRYQEDWLIKYRTIFIVIGYAIPLVITAISAGIYYKDYRSISNNVCWIDSSSAAFLSFLIPVSIIIGINLLVLMYIAKVLVLNYINNRKTKVNDSNELLVFIQLLVSMGFTWIPSYFAIISLTAMYVMVIAFPFQGFLMFLLVVVINKENRDKVSSFLVTITSKSTASSDKTYSKSKSSLRTKTTDQSDSLLQNNADNSVVKIQRHDMALNRPCGEIPPDSSLCQA